MYLSIANQDPEIQNFLVYIALTESDFYLNHLNQLNRYNIAKIVKGRNRRIRSKELVSPLLPTQIEYLRSSIQGLYSLNSLEKI